MTGIVLIVVSYFGVVLNVHVQPGALSDCPVLVGEARAELAVHLDRSGVSQLGYRIDCVEPGGVVLAGRAA